MGNEEGFRKIKDKLAGFETDFRDGSWRLFEQHRLKRERDRKLAGALRIGAVALVILGILTGSWFFSEPGKKVSRSGQSVAGSSKSTTGPDITAIRKGHDQRSRGIVIQRNANTGPVTAGGYSKSEKMNGGRRATVSVLPGLTLLRRGYPDVSFQPASALPGIWKGLLNRGPLFYNVNLQLPAIQRDEANAAGDSVRTRGGFQLSLGPAIRANYAKPSENRLTLGPSIFATFPITSKFALRGGLALMREHVYVSNANPTFTKNAVRWLNRGDYRWWELEVPIDMQVNLLHSPKYRLAGVVGVSSSLSWGEHFSEIYEKGKIVTTTLALYDGQVREVQGLASKQEEPLAGRSTGVVFAPVTYFSASVILEKKITTKHSVAIEPQLRYPVGGVTSRHLKFTSIGLQIRMSY